MSSRKHHAASDATTPTIAARTSTATNDLLRSVEAGSGPADSSATGDPARSAEDSGNHGRDPIIRGGGGHHPNGMMPWHRVHG